MTNPLRGTIKVTLADKEYNARLTIDSIVQIEQAVGMGITDTVFVVDTTGESHAFNLTDLTALMLQYGQARAVFSSQDAAKRTAIKNANTIEELNNL